MRQFPTKHPCFAPIQFLSHDYGPTNLVSLGINGGTVLLFAKEQKRYLITAWHIWDAFLKELSPQNTGRHHGAFVAGAGGELLPLAKDISPYYQDATRDIIVFTPDWISEGPPGCDFFHGDVASTAEGDAVWTYGYPKTVRSMTGDRVCCQPKELHGIATAPVNDSFRFAIADTAPLGGFSGAPVFREDGKLLAIVSEGGPAFGIGIVTCSELLSAIAEF